MVRKYRNKCKYHTYGKIQEQNVSINMEGKYESKFHTNGGEKHEQK